MASKPGSVKTLRAKKDAKRQRSERALRESEDKYRKLFDNTNDGFVLIEPVFDETGSSDDYLMLEINDALERQTGLRAADLVGKRVREALPGVEHDWPATFAEVARTGKDRHFESHNADSGRWYDLHAFPYRNGQVGVLFRDITERRRAEEALREGEEKFRGLFKSMDAGIQLCELIWDDNDRPVDKIILDVNPAYERHSGFRREQVVGRRIKEILPAVEQIRLDRYGEVVRLGKTIHFEEYNATHDQWFDVYASPMRGNRFAVIISNITKRKQAEKALKESKHQAELYLDLMGHDINNMHQIALGYLELAQGLPPGVQQGEMIGKSVEVLQRSSQLIQNVRKLQKLNEGVLRTSEVNLYQVLQDVGWEFGEISNKTIVLNSGECEKCLVQANELLHDVITNLVDNAVKHTGDHAVINISLETVSDKNCKYYRVNVEDNGPGIPDEYKNKIFDRMQRSTTNAKGMGLGLYLVKSLVDSYGGRVWVEDRIPGDHTKGARFVVMLPAAQN